MNAPMTKDLLHEARSACQRFETDLSAYVDRELSALDSARVSDHVSTCEPCRSFVNSLAGMARMQRALQGENQAVTELFGSQDAMWGGLIQKLLTDTEGRLANVLYELGKSLMHVAHESTPTNPAESRAHHIYEKSPGNVRSLTKQGTRLSREYGELQAQGDKTRRSRRSFRKRGLFPSSTKPMRGVAALESGRNCLEQCLRLDPQRADARIFLAWYYRQMGRLDRALQQLRIVERSEASPKLKAFAMHHVARIYAQARQFGRAMEVERGVVAATDVVEDAALHSVALFNLFVYAVKLDRLEDAEKAIARWIKEFPDRLADAVTAIARARELKRILAKNQPFLDRLRNRYPSLFAA